jgi:hypothetical protein
MQCFNCHRPMLNDSDTDRYSECTSIYWCEHCGTFRDHQGNWHTSKILEALHTLQLKAGT